MARNKKNRNLKFYLIPRSEKSLSRNHFFFSKIKEYEYVKELVEKQSNEESVINELIKDDYEQYAYYINSIYGKRDSNLPQVKSPEIFLKGDKNEKFHPEGLFSEQIFGPLSNYTCQCNITRYNAETVRCQKCGVKYSESTRSDQFGIIRLPF